MVYQDKAKELIERFDGKHYALLAVDEIQKALDVAMGGQVALYWHYVKEEIEKA